MRMLALAIMVPYLMTATLIRVDSRSEGYTFIVDTDSPQIRQALRDVAAPSPAGPLPGWAVVYPGAVFVDRPGPSDPIDFAHASWRTTAAPDAVFAHYESALRSAGVKVTYINRQPGRGGAIHVDDGMRTGTVSVSAGPGATDITVNWRPRVIKPALTGSGQLEAVWYDDSKQTLRLRDSATGREYELDGTALMRYAKSAEPLATAARADFPVWLAIYPGAKVDRATGPPQGWQPQKFIDIRSFNLELETQATVAQVAVFYRDTMNRNALKIESETESENGLMRSARAAPTACIWCTWMF